MGFKNDFIHENLTHQTKHYTNEIIENKLLFTILWYFVSKECYAQRNDAFDEYMDAITPHDYFFRIWLYRKFDLAEFKIFTGKMKTLDEQLDNLDLADVNKSILYLHISSKSAFCSLFEKMRNSLAHGTFNSSNNTFFMMGQKSSKKESPINFYFQLSHDKVTEIENMINILLDDINSRALYSNALVAQPQVCIENNSLMYGNKKILIEESFAFRDVQNHGSQLEQIKKYVESKDYRNVLIILCCTTNAIFDDEDLSQRNVGIIPYTHLPTFFNCNITVVS